MQNPFGSVRRSMFSQTDEPSFQGFSIRVVENEGKKRTLDVNDDSFVNKG